MLYNLPYSIQEIIFDFSGYKLDLQTNFKDNVAPKIDKTLKKNYCELCYIQTFKANDFCLIHSMIDYNAIQPKYYSLHNLPNGRTGKTLGKLFLAINNVEYFKQIISDIGFYNTHKLSEINNQIRQISYI
jgi:hypothetical protein